MGTPRAFVRVVFAAIVAIYAANFWAPPMPPIHGDGTYTYYWARSLAFDGDLDLRNDYALCGDPWGHREPVREGLGPQNLWSPGPSLVWVPFLLVGRVLRVDAADPSPAIAGGCPGSSLAKLAMTGSVVAGLLAVWLAYRLARRYAGIVAAALAALGVALATPLPYYATLLPSYAHAPAALFSTWFLERWDATRGDDRAVRWVGLGVLLGLAMTVRAQCAVLAVVPLVEWLVRVRQASGVRDVLARVRSGVGFVAATLLAFLPQMAAWRITYGSWLAVPQGEHFMRWGHPAVDGVLFASSGGLLVWSPLLYLAVLGLALAVRWRRTRLVGVAFAAALVAFVVVNGAVWDWWGASSFGARRFTALVGVFALGLALTLRALLQLADAHPRRFAVAALALALAGFAAWNQSAMWVVAKAAVPAHEEGRSDRFANRIFEEMTGNTWHAVGNPLSWPASIPFALRYGTHPRRYDLLRGEGLLYRDYVDFRLRDGDDEVDLTREPGGVYAARGFRDGPSASTRGDARVRSMSGDEATVLLPLFAGDVTELRLRGRRADGRTAAVDEQARDVRVTWNGVDLGRVGFPARLGWVSLPVPTGAARPGINEIRLAVPGRRSRVALTRITLERGRRSGASPATPSAPSEASPGRR